MKITDIKEIIVKQSWYSALERMQKETVHRYVEEDGKINKYVNGSLFKTSEGKNSIELSYWN